MSTQLVNGQCKLARGGQPASMESKVQVIGGVLRKIGAHANLDQFRGRLILQKSVYFMQVFGLNFGYDFNWYVYGPYASNLAHDAFANTAALKEKSIEFANPAFEKNMQLLMQFIGKHANDDHWMELAASLHFLKKINPKYTKPQIIEIVTNKQTHFTRDESERIWNHLKEFNLV